MVIDSSALIAILCDEPEAGAFAEAFQNAVTRLMSAASFLETAIVIESRYGIAGGDKLDQLVAVAQIRT